MAIPRNQYEEHMRGLNLEMQQQTAQIAAQQNALNQGALGYQQQFFVAEVQARAASVQANLRRRNQLLLLP